MAITDIGYQAMEYFFDLFMASPYHIAEQLFSGIPQQVSESDNNSFYALRLNEEILHAIKSMNHWSSPGNDGFTGHFYIACWDIIQDDLCAFIWDFFNGADIPRDISSTTLILIPKTQEANQLKDLRPISLSNFSGKIISKILALWVASLLPKMMDDEQACLVQGRNISTHIVLAQELMRYLNKKVTGAMWFLNSTWRRPTTAWNGIFYSEPWKSPE